MIAKRIFWAAASAAGLLIVPLAAQPDNSAAAFGRYRILRSAALNEERRVIVSLPEGYAESGKSYPVFVVLDGDEDEAFRASGLVRYLSPSQIPEMIVVGVPNVDRGRDLSVFPMDQLPTSSAEGAGRFLRFLADELVPFLDSQYRTTPYRILYGGSAAGQFALLALLNAPAAFDAYLTGGASLGIGGDGLLDEAEGFFSRQKSLPKFMSLVYYEKDNTVATKSIPRLEATFRRHQPSGFRWHVERVPGIGHVPPASLMSGLTALFADWRPMAAPVLTPGGGRGPASSVLTIEMRGRGDEIRYTLDGTDPHRRSLPYRGPLTVSVPALVKARAFRGGIGESSTIAAEFQAAPPQPAVSVPVLKPGLVYRYFERPWVFLPDRIDLVPDRTGVVPVVTLEPRRRDDGFVFEFEGLIKVPEDGLYQFFLEANSRAKLFIDGTPAAAVRFSREAAEAGGVLGLKSGWHVLRVLHANPWIPGQVLRLMYSGPGIGKTEVPAAVLAHAEK